MSKSKKQKKGIKVEVTNNTMQPTIDIHKVSSISKAVTQATNGSPKKDIYEMSLPQEEHTQSWSDLEDIRKNLADSIHIISTQVSEVLNRLKDNQIEIPTEVALAASTMYKDMVSIADDLVEISNTHNGKRHVITDENDLALLLETFNHYQALFERFRGLTFNQLLIITEFTMNKKETLDKESEAVIVEEVKKDSSIVIDDKTHTLNIGDN